MYDTGIKNVSRNSRCIVPIKKWYAKDCECGTQQAGYLQIYSFWTPHCQKWRKTAAENINRWAVTASQMHCLAPPHRLNVTKIQLLLFISFCIITLLEMPNFKWLNIIFNMLKVLWISVMWTNIYGISIYNRIAFKSNDDDANNCYSAHGFLLLISALAKMTESN